jgi:hypothetical protein
MPEKDLNFILREPRFPYDPSYQLQLQLQLQLTTFQKSGAKSLAPPLLKVELQLTTFLKSGAKSLAPPFSKVDKKKCQRLWLHLSQRWKK